jgi:hypothetical protein
VSYLHRVAQTNEGRRGGGVPGRNITKEGATQLAKCAVQAKIREGGFVHSKYCRSAESITHTEYEYAKILLG